jgi:hypothetical protein
MWKALFWLFVVVVVCAVVYVVFGVDVLLYVLAFAATSGIFLAALAVLGWLYGKAYGGR